MVTLYFNLLCLLCERMHTMLTAENPGNFLLSKILSLRSATEIFVICLSNFVESLAEKKVLV